MGVGLSRVGAALLVALGLGAARVAAEPPEPPPDAEMLLNLDMLKEGDLAQKGELYRKMSLFERLRLLETLKFLESPPDPPAATPAGKEGK